MMKNLRRLRNERGLTQAEIGELLGVHGTAVGHWECGRTRPTIEHLAIMARHFNVQIDWIAHDLATPDE